ncbi:hypothetical protein CC86DRAFT_472489 [Ophiobolus disseminans]|uniref:Uncharacterized protein n=1 Tax=Ophiobolus disseminans TaxID=1469910 RepID=A0A6A6ZCR7_9PLEO|nr:hypothetical protein CC86DRAFT_472489 [Ophiobolus disseminans]
MEAINITPDGFRQLLAAFDDPNHATFTTEAFEHSRAGASSNYVIAFGAALAGQVETSPDLLQTLQTRLDERLHPPAPARAPHPIDLLTPPTPELGLDAVRAGDRDVDMGADNVEDVQPMVPIAPRKRKKDFYVVGAAQKDKRRSGEIGRDAPPKNLDIRILGDLELTVDELAAFFPNHYPWIAYMARFQKGSWEPTAVARLICHFRGFSGIDDAKLIDRERNKLHKQKDKCELSLVNDGITNNEEKHIDSGYTLGTWISPIGRERNRKAPAWRCGLVDDIPLIELADGLAHWPSGKGVRHLTRAVRHVVALADHAVMLSDVQDFIDEHDLGQGLGPIDEFGDPDCKAHKRLLGIVDPYVTRHVGGLGLFEGAGPKRFFQCLRLSSLVRSMSL